LDDSNLDHLKNPFAAISPIPAAAFERIARAVEESNNAAAIVTYESLIKETAQSNPDKGKLRQLWDGLVLLAPGINTLVDAVSKVTSIFA